MYFFLIGTYSQYENKREKTNIHISTIEKCVTFEIVSNISIVVFLSANFVLNLYDLILKYFKLGKKIKTIFLDLFASLCNLCSCIAPTHISLSFLIYWLGAQPYLYCLIFLLLKENLDCIDHRYSLQKFAHPIHSRLIFLKSKSLIVRKFTRYGGKQRFTW